ncbi:MAG: XRE family transcriptional regulator [Bdellovibrionaceae bacterium]|nr:XRE family transcriptional regulator [Pseudobdellovibrionaceae bacterium]
MAKNKTLGKELLASLKEANSYHDGKINLRTENFELPDDPKKLTGKQIKQIRKTLNVSQPIFAKFLGVSDNAVKEWERGGSTPNGCALRLLEIAMNHPKEFFQLSA